MVLRREPLIVMIVARQHDVGTGCLEGSPEGVGTGIIGMQHTRAEPRMVPVGEDAGRRMGGQVLLEPALLR